MLIYKDWASNLLGLTNDSSQAYFLYQMDFEFDSAKSKANREKHGIDFIEAQQLWEDEDRLEIPARTEDEPRYVLMAAIKQKLWSAIFTYRKGRIRLISVREPGRKKRNSTMKAKNLEKMFDEGENIMSHLDLY